MTSRTVYSFEINGGVTPLRCSHQPRYFKIQGEMGSKGAFRNWAHVWPPRACLSLLIAYFGPKFGLIPFVCMSLSSLINLEIMS